MCRDVMKRGNTYRGVWRGQTCRENGHEPETGCVRCSTTRYRYDHRTGLRVSYQHYYYVNHHGGSCQQSSSVRCPPAGKSHLTRKSGNTCVCPSGKYEIGGSRCCSQRTCPTGQVRASNSCSCVNRCTSPKVWRGGRCVCPSSCSASQTQNSNTCACTNRCTTPPRTRWSASLNRCISICTHSQRWNGSRCVARCPTSLKPHLRHWNGSTCICTPGLQEVGGNKCCSSRPCPSLYGRSRIRMTSHGSCQCCFPKPSNSSWSNPNACSWTCNTNYRRNSSGTACNRIYIPPPPPTRTCRDNGPSGRKCGSYGTNGNTCVRCSCWRHGKRTDGRTTCTCPTDGYSGSVYCSCNRHGYSGTTRCSTVRCSAPKTRKVGNICYCPLSPSCAGTGKRKNQSTCQCECVSGYTMSGSVCVRRLNPSPPVPSPPPAVELATPAECPP